MRLLATLMMALGLVLGAATAPVVAQVQKTFVREGLASDAVRLEEKLRKDAASATARANPDDYLRDANALQRRDDPLGALRPLAALVTARPSDPAAWLAYARASALASRATPNNAYILQNEALLAAYTAYQRATQRSDEASALATLGELAAAQGSDWRLALDAYRASLDRQDDAKIRAIYEPMRAEHGFRILEYKVESDSASPRVCFQLSESRARGRSDVAPYVAVAGASNAAVTSEDQQLCVEGLKHGEHYAMVVRQGLPSAVGETLLASADYEIYVRDRSPQVHFTGKNYVLPRVGQEGIPLVSVNTTSIAIDILRIGDRNLVGTVRGDDFLSQLTPWRMRKFINEDGQKIWSGTLSATAELNRDVVTAFPVLEAVKSLAPGVYAMMARPDTGAKKSTGDEDESGSYDANATQWFVVSDLGLTALSGSEGVHVLVRSLASAAPRSGVEVRLVARNNEILGTQKTNADGVATFAPGLARGTGGMAPGVVVAVDGDDYNFLDVQQAAFDLTDRGVKGRPAPPALDAFLYAERGVYRSGETVNLTALLRDRQGVAVPALPLTLVVKRSDGVEYKRALIEDQGLGGRAFSIALQAGVPSGTWRVQAFVDPKSPALGETSFLVEDYVPERLDVTAKPQQTLLRPGEAALVDTNARWLYGAPGAGLEVSGDVTVSTTDGALPAFPGYVAGLQEEEFEAVKNDLPDAVTTDDKGNARIEAPIAEVDAPRPVQAKIVLRVAEPGGRAVERVVTLPISGKRGLIGVRKAFETISEGGPASFDVIAVGSDGARAARSRVQWTLSRVSNGYQWYNSGGRWGFEKVKSSTRIADGTLDIAADKPARINAPVGFGTHRLDIRSADTGDQPTSITFDVGWSGDASAGTPDLLETTLGRAAYAAGDALEVKIKAPFAGKATLAIVGDKVHALRTLDLKQGDNVVSLPVGADWGAGAYAVAFAHRPLDQAAKRMPGRALGVAWFSIDAAAHKLDVAIDAPAKIAPRQPITLPIRLAGLAPGEEAEVTVAAVDIGILNLTQYRTPDPSGFYFGQRQLGVEVRDLYGLLIDGMQGVRGAIRSGGDGGAHLGEGNKPTQEPLARYSGVVKVGADGVARVTFDLPAFNGAMRVMAVAWSKTRVGSAQADIIVRDPVVVQASLPRFLSLGDRSRLHFAIDNVEGAAGDYRLEIEPRGPVTVPADALAKSVKLATGGHTDVTVPITGAGIGRASLDLRLVGPNVSATQTVALDVGSGAADLTRRSVRTLQPGESVTVSRDLLADFVPGTGRVTAAVSLGGIDVPALLQALDRYPWGCTEQITSRAMPLLYVNRLASLEQLAIESGLDQRIRGAIERVLARQTGAGSFGLWSADSSPDLWLDAYVTDFLTRARENNFDVPQKAFDQALDSLRNNAINETGAETSMEARAYAFYVLARNGRPIMGDLRYLADTKLEDVKSPLARAQLAAALALLGDRGRAERLFAAAAEKLNAEPTSRFSRPDYGSRLRDGAALLALAAEANVTAPISRAALIVQNEQAATSTSSTQEQAWMVLAAEALAKQNDGLALEVSGVPQNGAFLRGWRGESLDAAPVTIVNRGRAPVQASITTSGAPLVPDPAMNQGYSVERGLYSFSGEKIAVASLKQNERAIVVLKVTELEAAYARLMLVDRLPAGLEIDNPDLFDGGSVEGLAWIKSDVTPVHTEYKDDRFAAAFDRNGADKATFAVAYVVRAVTPGRYVQPPASIEDMYRPSRFGRTAAGTFEVREK